MAIDKSKKPRDRIKFEPVEVLSTYGAVSFLGIVVGSELIYNHRTGKYNGMCYVSPMSDQAYYQRARSLSLKIPLVDATIKELSTRAKKHFLKKFKQEATKLAITIQYEQEN
jgi:hypothetical protein